MGLSPTFSWLREWHGPWKDHSPLQTETGPPGVTWSWVVFGPSERSSWAPAPRQVTPGPSFLGNSDQRGWLMHAGREGCPTSELVLLYTSRMPNEPG